MTWSYWLCETTTGRRLATFEPTEGRWNRRLNVVGQGTHALLASTLGTGPTAAARRASRKALTLPWARTLVQCWDDVPTYAGLITGLGFKRSTRQLVLDSLDLRALLARRTMFDWYGYGEGRVIRFGTNLSMAGNARSIVRSGFRLPGGAEAFDYDVPIVFESGGAGPVNRREWWNYNIPNVEAELADLQDEEGGPDVDFLPRWAADGSLEWLMRSVAVGGKALEWNLTAEQNGLVDVGQKVDALRQATVVHVSGDGQEADMKVKSASLTSTPAGMPKLERVESYSQKGDDAVLRGLANSALALYRNPTTQDSLAIRADGKPGVADLALGQPVRLYSRDDEWFDDGWVERELVGFSGGIDNTITLQVQPTGGA